MCSKMVEFGDTFFIILRKKPLIFLHWWHHITVLNAVWLTSFHWDPVGRWFGIVNLGVHALMYSYYALKSVNIYVPRKFAMFLTALQIGQMVWAVFLNLYSIHLKSKCFPYEISYYKLYNQHLEHILTISFSYLQILAIIASAMIVVSGFTSLVTCLTSSFSPTTSTGPILGESVPQLLPPKRSKPNQRRLKLLFKPHVAKILSTMFRTNAYFLKKNSMFC